MKYFKEAFFVFFFIWMLPLSSISVQLEVGVGEDADSVVLSVYNEILKLYEKDVEVSPLIDQMNAALTILTEIRYYRLSGDVQKADQLEQEFINMMTDIENEAKNQYSLVAGNEENKIIDTVKFDIIIIISVILLNYIINRIYINKIMNFMPEVK